MPTKKSPKESSEQKLDKTLKEFTREVKKIKNLELIHVFKHPVKLMYLAFLKGLMVGFGSVLGATVLVALFIYILAQISVVPIVGDFVNNILEEIQVEKDIREEETSSDLNRKSEEPTPQGFEIEVKVAVPESERSPFSTEVKATIPEKENNL